MVQARTAGRDTLASVTFGGLAGQRDGAPGLRPEQKIISTWGEHK